MGLWPDLLMYTATNTNVIASCSWGGSVLVAESSYLLSSQFQDSLNFLKGVKES